MRRRRFSGRRERQGGAADWRGVEPVAFFRMLREHTMMGFYGDPRHGGNRDRVAWKMLGLQDPPIRGRLHETPPPASRRSAAQGVSGCRILA